MDGMMDNHNLLYSTICLVHGTLGIVSSLLEDYNRTVECLQRATELVINGFPMFRDIIQNSNLFNFEAVNWPDIEDLQKIAGTNCILQQKERNRIKSDIYTFLRMLEGVVG
ncbi:hypothetical protein POM88_019215 [Heracleum sosnowskyi]|uniref:Uncharacterized protein n=1 Tax=Heracleum sosnowskyi TaxID=360622 RepID=A0AAD8N073_9APIA|nr:hypothetical protein POM88_019215 [Heracleum sosnowskyi]